MRRFLPLTLFAFGLAFPPTAAIAAAWTLEKGHGQAFVTLSASRAGAAFDASRSLNAAPRYQKIDAQAWLEYGLLDRVTVILVPGLQRVAIGTSPTVRGAPDYVELGARTRLVRGEDWVFSVQATGRWASNTEGSNARSVDNTRSEVDVRALFGYGFSIAREPAFLDVQVANRFRSAGAPNEVHADVTFGLRPNAKWLLLAQSFNVVSEGAGVALPPYDYFKFQPSVVYALSRRIAIQAGGFTTYAGRNAIAENGVLLGASYSF